MTENEDPIRSNLEIRDLGTRGYEVLVTVVNEGEENALISGANVEVFKDGVFQGIHPVSFPGTPDGRGASLGQFEIIQGRFHLGVTSDHSLLRFKVNVSCRYGDDVQTRQISRRIQTGTFTRKN